MKEIKTELHKTYIVRRAFDEYRPGDEFKPTGGKNDARIIEFYCDTVYNDKQTETKGRKKTASGGK